MNAELVRKHGIFVWECERCGSCDELDAAGGHLSCACAQEPDDTKMYLTIIKNGRAGPRRSAAEITGTSRRAAGNP